MKLSPEAWVYVVTDPTGLWMCPEPYQLINAMQLRDLDARTLKEHDLLFTSRQEGVEESIRRAVLWSKYKTCLLHPTVLDAQEPPPT